MLKGGIETLQKGMYKEFFKIYTINIERLLVQ